MSDYGEYLTLKAEFEKIEERHKKPPTNYTTYLVSLIKDKAWSKVESICTFLSQLDFSEVLSCEEEFVVLLLESENLSWQEEAMNAVSLWSKTHHISRLKKITIKNHYLQEHYETIIERLEQNS